MASEVSQSRIEEITATYKKLSRTPFIEQGWVKPDLPTTVMIQYSQRDVARNKKNRIVRSFFEGESFSFKPFPFAVNMTNVVLMEPSPSWAYLAVMRSIKEKGDEEEKYLLEIWDNGCIAATIPTEGKHGQVYADAFFGSLTWSSDEQYLTYIAERNPPKTSSFFNGKGGAEDEKKPKPGSKFELREDWGETYRGGNPVIVVASVAAESVCVVPGIPQVLSAGQVQWAPHNKNLIFTGWNTEPRRLGIIHCYNRPCAIYSVPIDVDKLFASKTDKPAGDSAATSSNEVTDLTTKLTLANACSRSPRFSADGKILVYLASDNLKTHNSASKLLTTDWIYSPSSASTGAASSSEKADAVPREQLVGGEERVIIDIVSKYPEKEEDFPGLYLGNLPTRCFIEDRKVMFSSQWRSLLVPLLVDLETGVLRKVTVPGCSNSNLNVQDVRKDVCALFDGSELNRVPFNFVGRWDHKKSTFRDFKVTPHPPSITEHAIDVSELSWETGFAPLPSDDPFNASLTDPSSRFPGIEYLLTLPSDFHDSDKSSKTPVILFPHGGPHAANTPIFLITPVFFAKLGYAVININYRGSLGFGKNFVDALPGHAGDMDVKDCHLALKHVLEKHSDKLDHSRIYVMGGSHGGFLTGHLLATPCPSTSGKWSAGVMINAVTNIAHCVGISDIPDWCYVESGVSDLKTGISTMFNASPISRIQSVNAPTLIVLGAADKRVPISQSIEYYHTLKQQGTKTRMLKYPGAGHGIVEPEQEADYLINTALWFEQHH
jgi:acylaminoacyl-peptidase